MPLFLCYNVKNFVKGRRIFREVTKMLQVNLNDEKNFKELLNLILSGGNYKLVLMKDNEPVANITFEEKHGEKFDTMNAEILN